MARPERGCTNAAYPSGSAMATPVGTVTRPCGGMTTSILATRSAPASPGCAYAGAGSSGSRRSRSTSVLGSAVTGPDPTRRMGCWVHARRTAHRSRACPTATAPYAERLWLGPLGWVLAGRVFAVMMSIAFLPVDVRLAVVVGVAVVGAGAALLAVRRAPGRGRATGRCRAGGAHIPRRAARPRSRRSTRRRPQAELGPRLDARAHLVLRGWIHTAVRVELRDPADPTPVLGRLDPPPGRGSPPR